MKETFKRLKQIIERKGWHFEEDGINLLLYDNKKDNKGVWSQHGDIDRIIAECQKIGALTQEEKERLLDEQG